jgi:hypothetical protein
MILYQPTCAQQAPAKNGLVVSVLFTHKFPLADTAGRLCKNSEIS